MQGSLERARTRQPRNALVYPPWRFSAVHWLRLLGRSERFLSLLPGLILALATLLVFWGDLAAGMIYFGADTTMFYFPLTAWYAAQLQAGRLPLWFPNIFGGYPLFADGEVGMLYPLHLLAYALFPADAAFVWLRPLHVWLAGMLTFWYARLLGQSRFGALLAGLVFSFGSFVIGHLQHENIIRSTIWLPLALGFMELALRQEGRRRLTYLLACGLVVGIQALGVHVQPVLLTLLALGVYALAGPLVNRLPGRQGSPGEADPPGLTTTSTARRRAQLLGALGYLCERWAVVCLVACVGLGVAAVQLLPLYQLGEHSMRAGGVSYEYSTSYSVPPAQLLQLVLPYLFRPDETSYFGLWSAIETTVYFGVAPLVLALVAALYLHRRAVAFCGAIGLLSLLLALGDYLPLKLYSLVWSLPGFSYLRVPARFSLFVVLAGAVLAGFAADWLSGRQFDGSRGQPPRVRRLALLGLAFGLSALALGGTFVLIRTWLGLEPDHARSLIDSYYLSLRRGEWALSNRVVYFGLQRVMDLTNPRTAGALVLMLASATWLLLRGHRLLPRRIWQTGLLVLVIWDLTIFAQGFNPQQPLSALGPSLPVERFLAEHTGQHRVFIEPSLYGVVGPNRLVNAEIQMAGGYSSLPPRQATEYWWSMVRQDSLLLDLFNIRYVAVPRWEPRPAFEGVDYHPVDRLLRGSALSAAGTEQFQFGLWWTETVTVIAAGVGIANLPAGTPVAELVVAGPEGEQRILLRAGVEVGDGASPPVTASLLEAPARPRLISNGPAFQEPNRLSAVYAAQFKLERPLLANSVTVRTVSPAGGLDLFGIGLHDRPGLPAKSIRTTDRAKYSLVYQDDKLNIYENRQALPRAWLADSARAPLHPGRPIADEMLLGDFDPFRTALVEGVTEPLLPPSGESSSPGSAEIVAYEADRVVIQTSAARPAFLVLADRFEDGWRVSIDGREQPLYRTNGLFRGVPIDAGQHLVAFSYRPASVSLGLLISAFVLATVLLTLLWSQLPTRGRESRRRLARAS